MGYLYKKSQKSLKKMKNTYFEMIMQVRKVNADQSVELIKHEFEHWQFSVEEVGHGVSFNNFSHYRKC